WTASDRRVVEYIGEINSPLRGVFGGGRDSVTRVHKRTITRLDLKLTWVVDVVDSSYEATSFDERRRFGRMVDSLWQEIASPQNSLGEAESLDVRDEAGGSWVHLRRRPSGEAGAAGKLGRMPLMTTVEWWEARSVPGGEIWSRFEARSATLIGPIARD